MSDPMTPEAEAAHRPDIERALRIVFSQYAIVPDGERIDGPHVVIIGNANEAARLLAPKVGALLEREAAHRDSLVEKVRALRTPPPRFLEDGRPNPNGYEGGFHDAIEEVWALLAAEPIAASSRMEIREALERVQTRLDDAILALKSADEDVAEALRLRATPEPEG